MKTDCGTDLAVVFVRLNKKELLLMKTASNFFAASLLAFLAPAAWALPLTVSYSYLDVADTVPGADRWQVAYAVTGSMNPNESFDVVFAASDFASLSIDVSPLAGWFAYTLDPDISLLADGFFSAQIDGSGALPADFTVSFDWLGGAGTPGAQSVVMYDDFFNVIGNASTTPQQVTGPGPGPSPNPIPEPGSVLLFAGGLAALFGFRRKKISASN